MRGHLHLLHHVYSKTSNQLLANLRVKKLSEIELSINFARLPGATESSKIVLNQLLPLIKPNHWPEPHIPKAAGKSVDTSAVSLYRYRIKPLGASNKNFKANYHKRAGQSKEIHITTDLHPKSVKHFLRLAYGHLQTGSRVEFHLRPKYNKIDLTVDWALGNLPYLRPDVILMCMPEGTKVIVPPLENVLRVKLHRPEGKKIREIMWAFSQRPEDIPSEDPKTEARRWINGNADYQAAVRRSKTLFESQNSETDYYDKEPFQEDVEQRF